MMLERKEDNMQWHIVRAQEVKIQKADESNFRQFFDQRGYCPVKLDKGAQGTAPDYRLTRSGVCVFAELKSRFRNENYEKIGTKLITEIDKLGFGFNYTFEHEYDRSLSKTEMRNFIAELTPKLANITVLESPKDISVGNAHITLEKDNNSEKMQCVRTIKYESYCGKAGDRDKSWFKDRMDSAKRQLRDHIDKEIVGVIFFNHSTMPWTILDVMALYGELEIQNNFGWQGNALHMRSGEDKIIGIDRKSWLSYFGFCGCNEDGSFITIYRNGFARPKIQLPKDFFPEPECKTYTIGPYDGNGHIITDIPFLKQARDPASSAG